jgi:hypothetical protein
VYVYSIDGVPSYVGKGVNGRDQKHLRVAAQINDRRAAGEKVRATRWQNFLAKAMREQPDAIVIEHVAEGLDDDAAWLIEIDLIAHLGRRGIDEDGTLYNELAGGDGPTSEDQRRIFNRPEVRAAYADPAVREKMSARATAANARPEYKAKLAAASADPAYRAKMSASVRATTSTPEYRAKRAALAKAYYSDPAARAAHSVVMSRPETRAKLSALTKAAYARPEVRARRAAMVSPDYRRRQSIWARARPTTIEAITQEKARWPIS